MDERALEHAVEYIKPWLQRLYDLGDTPGFVVAIAHKGKIILNEAYGFADLERQIPMKTGHLFRIASHSKTFTATAVMQLQERKKLKIDDYIADHLTWLKKHKDPKWPKVTIRQVLSHGAGIIRDGNNSDYWNVYRPFPSEDEFKREILDTDLVIENNKTLKYSNFGYTLLGILIAEVSGRQYNDYVTENIIQPLGLKNTGPEYEASRKEDFVTGYTRMDTKKKRLPIEPIDTRAMSSATGFYSNAADLCKYFSAHMPGSIEILDDESKKEMQRVHWHADNTKDRIDYGLGLDIEYAGGRRVLGHGGGFPGNITKSLFDPKDELIVIVLTNTNGSRAGYIDHNIIKVINYFQKNKGTIKWKKYEGRYSDLWHAQDVVAVGDKLVVASADDWEPFGNPEELEHVKGDTFKVSKTDSFSSVGEAVEFKLDSSGKVNKRSHNAS
jgi:D-alanyl-D-alanine carboxypeptidase